MVIDIKAEFGEAAENWITATWKYINHNTRKMVNGQRIRMLSTL